MTYSSCWIEDLSQPRVEGHGLEAGALIASVDSPGVFVLHDWAKSKDLPVAYIDNCWIRVTVSGAELSKFMERHVNRTLSDVRTLQEGSASSGRAIVASISPEGRYVIVAEEF
jgi:hypothetical protein